MTFLLNNRPNWIIPVFRQTGFIIEYKRFPADYMWRGFLDLSGVVFDPTSLQDQIDALVATDETFATQIIDLAATDVSLAADIASAIGQASAAQADATTALANAATALTAANEADDTADAAQSTATAAGAAAAAAQSTATAAAAAAAAAQSTANAALVQTSLPDCAYLVPSNFRTISGGFATPVLQSGQWTHAYSDLNGSGSLADCKILLAAGDYDYSLGYIKGADEGNLALKINGTASTTSIPSMYNATTLLGQIVEGQLISGLSAGLHTIRFEVTGKQVASSGFHCRISFLAIRKRP